MAADASTIEETIPKLGHAAVGQASEPPGEAPPPFAAASSISAQIVISATANRLIGVTPPTNQAG